MSLAKGTEVSDEKGRPILRYLWKHEARFILFQRLVNDPPPEAAGVLVVAARLAGYRLYDVEEVEAAIERANLSTERQEQTIPVRDYATGDLDDLTIDVWTREAEE